MDRVFLEANVLFSAAYGENSGLLRLWALEGAAICTSRYAVEEARRNLPRAAQRDRLTECLRTTTILAEAPPGVALPLSAELAEKDAPILLAAIHGVQPIF